MMNHNMQMQKETGKILHRKFLSENIGLLLMAPVFLLLMFIVSNLYQLPAEYAFYLTSIFLILWVTTLCMQYRGFRKRTEQYEKESKEKQESNSKESRQWEELQEKQDFFALWAHQIKTPIAALNLLLQGEKQDAAVCRQELFKIESYVEMALNYLRFEEMSNDLVLERNSLEQLVRQVVKKYAAIFIYNHISIQLEHLDYTVLTDEKYFGGTLEDVANVRQLVKMPILRKDLTIDEYQLHQAKAFGADAVLLIAAAISETECRKLARIAHELGLETLLEVHNEDEISYLCDDIDVVGVNNRHLGTFHTDISTSEFLAPQLPQSITRISESGIRSASDIIRLQILGYRGFLIGEQFMNGDNPPENLGKLNADIEKLITSSL